MSDGLHEAIGRALQKCRRDAAMSRQDLARRIGVSAERITDYELAGAELEAAMLWRICRATATSTDAFWGEVSLLMWAAGAAIGRRDPPIRRAATMH